MCRQPPFYAKDSTPDPIRPDVTTLARGAASLDALDGPPGEGLHLLDPQDAAARPDQAPEHGCKVAAAAPHVQHLAGPCKAVV